MVIHDLDDWGYPYFRKPPNDVCLIFGDFRISTLVTQLGCQLRPRELKIERLS